MFTTVVLLYSDFSRYLRIATTDVADITIHLQGLTMRLIKRVRQPGNASHVAAFVGFNTLSLCDPARVAHCYNIIILET